MILLILSFSLHTNILVGLFTTFTICLPLPMRFFSPHNILVSAAAAAKSLQSCLTLCDPKDGRPPGSPIAGILQARTLEWVAISFSNAGKWKVKVKSISWDDSLNAFKFKRKIFRSKIRLLVFKSLQRGLGLFRDVFQTVWSPEFPMI